MTRSSSQAKRDKQRAQFKRRVHERDDYTCQYCAVDLTPETATVDHVHPVSRGGLSDLDNLVSSCTPCNNRKANRTPAEAGMPLLTTVGILRGSRRAGSST